MKQPILPPQAALIAALSDEMIPLVSADGVSRLILTQPPWRVPPGVEVRQRPAPMLRDTGEGRSHLFLNRWKEENMHAIRFPYLCCVLEGEIDMRIGTSIRRKKTASSHKGGGSYRILTLPQSTFLLILPGVPYPATGLQWERPHLTPANSRVLWVQMLPSGPYCHLSTTRDSEFISYPGSVVPDPQIATLSTLLIEELKTRSDDYEILAKNLFLALLLRIRRALRKGSPVPTRFYQGLKPFAAQDAIGPRNHKTSSRRAGDTTSPANAAILERARAYIRAHHNEALTLHLIASQTHVSPSHLVRLFRLAQGTTVMSYLTRCRLEMAKSLLENTSLTVSEIGRLVGYENPPHFCKVFKEQERMTPTTFREHCPPIEVLG